LTRPRPAGPVLKWAGGKRQLLPQLRPFFQTSVARYFEPFLGSGAVFFDLCASGRLEARDATLSDDNADLVGTYLRVRDATDELIDRLAALARRHARDGRAHYYRVRDEKFNPGRKRWVRAGGDPASYPTSLAAMLLYLNRTGYNGLFRLNAAGEFNVPAGRYDAPEIINAERLRAAAAVLTPAVITHEKFATALQQPKSGDLVYLDPPYAPLTRTANFRSYTAAGFSNLDQQHLRDDVVRLAQQGVRVVLSNSTAPAVVALYDDAAVEHAGLRCHRVRARRAINTKADGRGFVEELVVSNIEPVGLSALT
jgi:DNA adenine methylase